MGKEGFEAMCILLLGLLTSVSGMVGAEEQWSTG
jgi:hypothetical protein